MIRLAGILTIVVAVPAAATPSCPPFGITSEVSAERTVITLDHACLTDPTDTGITLAQIAREMVDTHLSLDKNETYVSVEEVLVESFVSEILVPSDPTAPAN